MKTTILLSGILLSTSCLSISANENTETITTDNQVTALDTVKVSADFRDLDLQQIPSAITVVSEDDIKNRNADHLESILSLAPNVNFSSGASRGRYFQIRGIGERSQFIDSVNPSVGLIIDGIDMTGLGGAATLFDVEQVEILRGPQGTAFGANALAGAINIKSKQPTKETEGYIEAKAGNYNTQGIGGAISGSLADNVQARFAINQFKTDGYMKNIYLDRDDTNNIDETVARAQVVLQINEKNDISISLLKTDIDNGYDAFSLENNRNTFSNNPGKDTQDTTAAKVSWTFDINDKINLESSVFSSTSNTTYSYDEDWSYGTYDSNGDCLTECIIDSDPLGYVYSTFDQYNRKLDRNGMDARIISSEKGRIFNNSTDWIVGFHSQEKNESLERLYTADYEDPDNIGAPTSSTSIYNSEISYKSSAVYSELNSTINHLTSIIYGLRIENWDTSFTDKTAVTDQVSEVLVGGKITLESLVSNNHLAYTSISKGYKPGGINSDPEVAPTNRNFETETNYSLEVGIKSSLLDSRLNINSALFFIKRVDQQVKSSYVIPGSETGGAPEFQDYLTNAAEGQNLGFEIESLFNLNDKIIWGTSLGYLDTEFVEYTYETDDGTVDKTGREQAHAPLWSLSSNLNVNISKHINITLEAEAKDAFYFSDSHDEKSTNYILIHAKLEYQNKDITLSLAGRNLTDEEFPTRGFGGFGNDPRNGWVGSQYTQLGDPRLITLQARYSF